MWILPRGLITAVLAIEVIEARGGEFAFLPALAFAIILVTNVLVIVGSIRSGPRAEGKATVDVEEGQTVS